MVLSKRLVIDADRYTVIRLLVIAFGILLGLGVYSYGMFHTLLPTWPSIANVANCGLSPGTPYQVVDTTLGQYDSPLCQVAPGQWIKTPFGNGPFFLALTLAFASIMVALLRGSLLKVATSSAMSTVTLFVLLFGIPMVLLGLHLNFIEGTLTVDWALHVIVYGLLVGAAMGLLMWYTLIRGLRARATSNYRMERPREP